MQTRDQDLRTSGQNPKPSPIPEIRLEKTIEQFAAEQGIKPMIHWNDYCGAARDLWEDNEDFEEFLRAARRPYSERV